MNWRGNHYTQRFSHHTTNMRTHTILSQNALKYNTGVMEFKSLKIFQAQNSGLAGCFLKLWNHAVQMCQDHKLVMPLVNCSPTIKRATVELSMWIWHGEKAQSFHAAIVALFTGKNKISFTSDDSLSSGFLLSIHQRTTNWILCLSDVAVSTAALVFRTVPQYAVSDTVVAYEEHGSKEHQTANRAWFSHEEESSQVQNNKHSMVVNEGRI